MTPAAHLAIATFLIVAFVIVGVWMGTFEQRKR